MRYGKFCRCGLISESFMYFRLKYPKKVANHSLSLLIEESNLAPFIEDLRQSEKCSKIKSPLPKLDVIIIKILLSCIKNWALFSVQLIITHLYFIMHKVCDNVDNTEFLKLRHKYAICMSNILSWRNNITPAHAIRTCYLCTISPMFKNYNTRYILMV